MFCRKCGAQIDEQAVICPKCGVQVCPKLPVPYKYSALTWAIVGFFFCGVCVGLIAGLIGLSQADKGLRLVALCPEEYEQSQWLSVAKVISIISIIVSLFAIVLLILSIGGMAWLIANQ